MHPTKYGIRLTGCRRQTQQKTYRNSTPAQHGTTASQRFTYTAGTCRPRDAPASPPCPRLVLGMSPFCTCRVHRMSPSCNRFVHKAGGPVWSVRRQHPCCQHNSSPHAGLRPFSGHSVSTSLCSTKKVGGKSLGCGFRKELPSVMLATPANAGRSNNTPHQLSDFATF